MPTILVKDGFAVRIYTLDHPPAHVHVAKAGAVLKIDLARCEAVEIVGSISNRNVRRAELLVAANVELLRDHWSRIHG